MKNSNVDSVKLLTSSLVSLYFFYYFLHFREWHFIDNVNLIIHEAGHAIMGLFPPLIAVASGSLFQVIVPLIFALYFFIDRQHFSGSLILFWVGQNLMNVSIYAGDAIAMQLPLLGGDSSIHDWNFILSNVHLLEYTSMIAKSIYTAGVLTLLCAAILSFLYSRKMQEFHIRNY